VTAPRTWAGILRLNGIFFGGLLLWTALFLPIGFLAWIWQVKAQGKEPRTSIRKLVWFYGAICCKLLGSQTPVTVADRAGELPRPCIVAANHQSFFDPYCIGFFPVYAPVFVVRAWPFRIPLYGRIMRRAGYLNIEELDQETFFRKAEGVLRDGATLVVFPEGTRSATGKMGRFHAGAFTLAVKCAVPIVPMCIDGSGRVFPKGSRFGRPAPLRVTLLPPVHPSLFAERGEIGYRYFRKNVKEAIGNELERHSLSSSPV
jgi:1-acyl-sn-glycerol-3-phosphate acyltransferase